jgi:hypothetical protein
MPAGLGGLLGDHLALTGTELLCSSLAALFPAHTSKGYRMRVALIFRRIGKGIPVHLFTDGVLYNFAGDLHEVALRGWAFRHESIMPRIQCRPLPLWKSD